jgi:hypothetical protein
MEKSRNLSKSEYFDAVQREYIIADFKRRFYSKTKDKEYYAKVARFKAEKINDIANRNNLLSVLNSEQKYQAVRKELINDANQPLFSMSEADLFNYYRSGCEVAYQGEIWILDSTTPDYKTAMIYDKNTKVEKTVNICEISRIL